MGFRVKEFVHNKKMSNGKAHLLRPASQNTTESRKSGSGHVQHIFRRLHGFPGTQANCERLPPARRIVFPLALHDSAVHSIDDHTIDRQGRALPQQRTIGRDTEQSFR